MPLNLMDSLIANGTKVSQPHVQQPPISRFFALYSELFGLSSAANQLFPHQEVPVKQVFPPERMGSSPLAYRGHDQNKITQFIFICYGREASGFRMAASSARLPQTQLQILIYDNLILRQITFPATMEIYPEKVWDFLPRDYCNSHELIY